jgi:hypothetical protein
MGVEKNEEKKEKEKKKKEKKHEYHIVLAEGMVLELKELGLYKETKNLSKVIEKILTIFVPAVEVEQEWGKQRKSKYRYISADPEEQRIDVAVYLPEIIYRQLKQVHNDLDFYSIAQIVREFVELFFSFVKKYGDEGVFPYLEGEFKRWEEDTHESRLTIYEFVPHILEIIRFLPNIKGMITIYDENFVPFYYYRL